MREGGGGGGGASMVSYLPGWIEEILKHLLTEPGEWPFFQLSGKRQKNISTCAHRMSPVKSEGRVSNPCRTVTHSHVINLFPTCILICSKLLLRYRFTTCLASCHRLMTFDPENTRPCDKLGELVSACSLTLVRVLGGQASVDHLALVTV